MNHDVELLRAYVQLRDESAFKELVQRHLPVVLSAALRRVEGRRHAAEDVSQKVFSDLARRAPTLLNHPALIAWLYRSTRYAAIDWVRAEQRQKQLTQSLAAMDDSADTSENSVEWNRLRPVLDAAMDQLNERDREVMLLRYFSGLSYVQVGEQLKLNENAARMRADRALERLGQYLRRHGITSTSTALSLLLVNSAAATAVPSTLVATVASTALAAAPVGSAAVVTGITLMAKIIIPTTAAALAAALTFVVYQAASSGVSARELDSLRAEQRGLTRILAVAGNLPSVASGGDALDNRVTAIARVVDRGQASANATAPSGATTSGGGASDVSPTKSSGHRNHGQATPADAFMSFAWADDAGEVTALSKLIWFDEALRAKAWAVHATMSPYLRAQYPTPEELYAFFFAADALVAPPPGADVVERFEPVTIREGRVGMRAPGANRNQSEYQLTPDGWKWVVPEAAVPNAPKILNNETLAKLAPSAQP